MRARTDPNIELGRLSNQHVQFYLLWFSISPKQQSQVNLINGNVLSLLYSPASKKQLDG